jgi:hypothetical protein
LMKEPKNLKSLIEREIKKYELVKSWFLNLKLHFFYLPLLLYDMTHHLAFLTLAHGSPHL